YINDRHLPDKAIDVIDEAGAAQRILPVNKRKKTISKAEVEEIVAKIARIPPASVSSDDRSKLQTLERDLKNVVFGQDKALDVLASAVKMARSGLGKGDKPIGAFLFSGPTGVGKTEKAHPDIFNVLLQVMDHGTLTDNNGRKADFRNVIIVMTTNAGAEAMNKSTIGFTNAREQGDEMADIKRLFTPEFRNRLDATVSFRAL